MVGEGFNGRWPGTGPPNLRFRHGRRISYAGRLGPFLSGLRADWASVECGLPERWVRFHSLPGSKRYPESETEHAEVVARHNAILGELSRPSAQVVLVTTGYSDSPVPSRSHSEVVAFDPDASPWRTVAMHCLEEGFANPSYWHLFASAWSGAPVHSTRSSDWSPRTRWPTCWWLPRIAGGYYTRTMAAWT